MKLLFITKEDCPYCVEKREMVYQQLPETFEGIVIEEHNISQDAEYIRPYYTHQDTPAFVFLTDEDKPMFTIIGVPGLGYIKKMVADYQRTTNGPLSDDQLDFVVGGMLKQSLARCHPSETTCVQ